MTLKAPFDRITIEPGKLGGKPCIRGLRISVETVLNIVASYPDRKALFDNYPDLEEEDLRQALAYAAAQNVEITKHYPKLPPVHPGEILKETLADLGISMNRLSKEIHVPANRISSIVAGQRAITGETALRLGRYFGTTPEYWLNMQARYELETARDQWADRVKSEVRPRNAA